MKMIRIRPDDEYNAEAFWAALDEQYRRTADRLRLKGEARVTPETWAKLRTLPGFSGGPEHAPEALIDRGLITGGV